MSISTKNKHNHLLMFILTLGVFGILNTEMGVVGIIPIIAETFGVTVPDAGWTVSLFALIIAFSAPVVPLLFSRVNRKTVMVLALSVFVISNLVSVFTTNFTVLLITRAIPAFFHPLYVSIAFSTAASSVSREDAPKAVSKIFAGVSAGMVLGVPVTSPVNFHSLQQWYFLPLLIHLYCSPLFSSYRPCPLRNGYRMAHNSAF